MGRSSLLVCAFVIEKGSDRMLNLVVVGSRILKTYLLDNDTQFKMPFVTESMTKRGTLSAIFECEGETKIVEDVKNEGIYNIPNECLGKEFSVYIENYYGNGVSRTKKLAIRLLGGGGSGSGGTTYSNSEIVSMIDEAQKEAIASANDYTDDEIDTVTEFEEEAVDFSNWQ